MGQPHMSQSLFINKFFSLYQSQNKYNIIKGYKLHHMKQIENSLDG